MTINLNNKLSIIIFISAVIGIIFIFSSIKQPLLSSNLLIPESNEKSPPGMVYIPAGDSILGADDSDHEAFPGEKPRRKVFIKGFYIDKFEVTNEDYKKCVKAGGCRYFRNIKHPMFRDSLGSKQPAVPLSWKRAYDYCKWAGKRLPTEAEWEKVARGGINGTIYPWGNDSPACDKASYRPCNKTTKSVGSYKAGHYGVYDMAGNGYEWVNDWATNCYEGCGQQYSCGNNCSGKDPLGPCSGRYPCGKKNRKILKGGSWWWPSTQLRGSWRRPEKIHTGGHRLSARCASDSPILTKSPGWMILNPPKKNADPKSPTVEELEIFHDIETDKLNKTICAKKWTSPAHCKDPESYVVSNERLLYYFAPYLKNLGGGYAGVAADANYTFIAHARSRWVWLFDFDKNIISLHKILKSVIMKSLTPSIFVERFHSKKEKSTLEIIRAAYGNDLDYEQIKYVFFNYRSKLYPFYKNSLKPDKNFKDFGWLRNRDAYRYIRLLYSQNRISISPGDMLKDKTIRSIAISAKKLGIPIRIYYPSNAEEFWRLSSNYKGNILSIPFDGASVVIRTIHEYPWHRRMRGARFWHYVIHGAKNYQKKIKLKDYNYIDHFRHERIFPDSKRDTLSTIHLPSSLPEKLKKSIY